MKARFILASLVPLCCAPLLTGCIVVTEPATPAQPPMQVVEIENTVPVQLAAGLADGKPPHLRPDAGMNYWVWQGPRNAWHVRTTTNKKRRFQGRIRPLQGAAITSLKATQNESGDRVRRAGGDIVFDVTTKANEDGFDFGVKGDGCLEMDLRIQNESHPGMIKIGATEETPQSSHIIVCP